MQVVSIISTKGGVGKTTTAANLGGFAADAGLRVLLLDLDVGSARERTRGRDLLGEAVPDRIESERDAFFERVRQGFRDRAAREPARIRVLDAGLSVAQVAANAVAALVDYRRGLA